MIDLVGLAAAKMHLNQDGTHKDTDIQLKISAASAIVMRHMKLTEPLSEWALGTSPETYEIPANIQAATMLVLGGLYEARESNSSGSFSGSTGILTDAVKDLLPRIPTQA